MAKSDLTTAAQYLPAVVTLRSLTEGARGCRACPLWRRGTQTVFGEGPTTARAVLVGEQPGNDEDLSGHPFVGPAGRMLDRGLEEADIPRSDIYVTNVVKHFKWVAKGKRRLHTKPNAREIGACIPWLDAEIALLEPDLVVCLGATAAQAVIGPDFRVTVRRGAVESSRFGYPAIATVHPSSLLRLPPEADRKVEWGRFVADLREVARRLRR